VGCDSWFDTDTKDEIIEEVYTNDHNIRGKGDPSASKSKYTPPPTNKNTITTRSLIMRKYSNLEYNILYDMQKTWTNISIYGHTKLTQQIDLLPSHLNQMKGRLMKFSTKVN